MQGVADMQPMGPYYNTPLCTPFEKFWKYGLKVCYSYTVSYIYPLLIINIFRNEAERRSFLKLVHLNQLAVKLLTQLNHILVSLILDLIPVSCVSFLYLNLIPVSCFSFLYFKERLQRIG